MNSNMMQADGAPISVELFRRALALAGPENVNEIRISPYQTQFYEEQGFATVQWVKDDAGPIQGASSSITICGKAVLETVKQPQQTVDFLGAGGDIVGGIDNLRPVMEIDPSTGRAIQVISYQ